MQQLSTIPAIGTHSEDVIKLQKALGIKADGIFGPATKHAVVAFQTKHKISATGVLGPTTLKLLGFEVVPVHPVTGSAKTRPLAGRRSSRHLHPTLRLLMEGAIFRDGLVPDVFSGKQVQGMVMACARGLASLNIKESGGDNHGRVVGYIQAIIGAYVQNGTGDSWCDSTDQCIVAFIEDYLQIESPMPASELCTATWTAAKRVAHLTTPSAEVGTFFMAQHGSSTEGHTGTVLAVMSNNQMETFEGNHENAAIISTRSQTRTDDLHTLGFVRVFPNNRVD